jgi:hypothetical protein
MKEAHGWDYVNENQFDYYINTIKSFINNDAELKTFRQKLGTTGILERDTGAGQLWLNMILNKFGDTILKEKLSLFKRNDIYGAPAILNYGEYGDICPFTLLYIWQGLNTIHKFKTNKFNKIVEIGTGYGALCIIMDSLCEYDEYVIVDLPDVVELNRKYLINFPEIYKKVTFIPCNTLTEIPNVDVVISIAAISECSGETQIEYFNKIIKNSKYAYLGYNRQNSAFLNLLSNEFDIDTENSGISEYYLTKKIF